MKSLELEKLWSWLPTFRVVAEHDSVQEAARVLRLSASSISRTIRLLESELGRPVFERHRGRLRLNPAGQMLLDAVRRSMRLIDDGITSVRGLDGLGPLRVSAPRDVVPPLLLPVVARARAASPSTCVYIRHDGDARAVASGVVDIALVFGAAPAPGIEVHRIGSIGFSVYCGRRHALWDKSVSGPRDLLDHEFIVNDDDPVWPPELQRTAALATHDCATAVEACIRAVGLAVLPDPLARAAVTAGKLQRVGGVELGARDLFALRRPLLVADRAQAMIVDLMRSLETS